MLTWVAEYEDGKFLKQFKGKKEHPFSEVDQKRLKTFSLVNEKSEMKFKVDMDMRGKKLVYRRRHYVVVGKEDRINHILGWEDKSGKHLMFITPNEEVYLTDNFELM